jgi:hypothetical protein
MKLNSDIPFHELYQMYELAKQFYNANEEGLIYLTREEINFIKVRCSKVFNVLSMGIISDILNEIVASSDEIISQDITQHNTNHPVKLLPDKT